MKKKLTDEEEKINEKKAYIFIAYCAVVLFFVVRWIIINDISLVHIFIGIFAIAAYYWFPLLIVIGGIGLVIAELLYKYFEEISAIVILLLFFLFIYLFGLFMGW